jgi:hypothetical protein
MAVSSEEKDLTVTVRKKPQHAYSSIHMSKKKAEMEMEDRGAGQKIAMFILFQFQCEH